MILHRKMYDYLLNWRQTRGEECLFVKGARQVGKTFLVEQFGQAEYDSFIEIDFLKNPSLKGVFQGDLDSGEVLKRLTAFLPNIHLIEGSTLLFLDEIQTCSRARTALKFLARDRRFDVIASGSLLGLHYAQDDDDRVEEVESIPVGYEHQVTMHSLDFQEFMAALGYGPKAIELLREHFDTRTAVPPEINEKYEGLFREFMVIGGMPEAVDTFARTQDFNQVQRVQEKILATYDDDIANHAKGAEKAKVRECYQSVPMQLARENKKFRYSSVEKKATARKFSGSIQWLEDSGLVHVSRNVREPLLPLRANAKGNEFKLYVNDTGLLLAKYGQQTKLAVLQNTILGNAKGGIYENAVSESLVKSGHALHYYKTPDSTMEIEFLIESDGAVAPVEVKAGNNASASLNHFQETFAPSVAFKLISGNVGRSGVKVTLPHYMVMFL